MNDFTWTDLAAGQNASLEVELTAEMFDRFAELSGDYNPLHMDESFAQASGFTARVAFGLLTSAFYSRLVGMYLPGKRALVHGLDVDFKSPAYIGDRLSVCGEITYLNEAYRRLEIKAKIVNQAGKVVSKAEIRVGVQ